MDLTTSSVAEGWRIRIDRPGQPDVRYYDSKVYPTEAEAIAAVGQAVRGDGKFTKSRLGIQWQRVETIKGQVDWIHDVTGIY